MNVQNIPKKDKVVKGAFLPKLDAFIFCDFPNIELKLLAFYLESIGHPSMAETFREGADLHARTASGLFGMAEADVVEDDRQTAKRVNFSIVYGGGIPTLIEQGVVKDAPEALSLLKKYHATWPGIGWGTRRKDAADGTLAWWLKQRMKPEGSNPKAKGYITTLWGRHLHPHSDHVLINHLCQGCAADLIKEGMIKVHRHLKAGGFESHLVNSVHDELALDCVRSEVAELARVVPELMNNAMLDASVPIKPVPEISWTTWAAKAPYIEAQAA